MRLFFAFGVIAQVEGQLMPVEMADELMNVGDWQDTHVDVALDSGACRHVMAYDDVPCYVVHDSPGSRRGPALCYRPGVCHCWLRAAMRV